MKHPLSSLRIPLSALAAFSLLTGSNFADENAHPHEHDHDHRASGPNGGKVIHSVEPHLEFLVNDEREVQISALDENGKTVPIEGQVVRLIGGSRVNPTLLTFTREGDVLASDQALPEGNDFPVVLQIKPDVDGKTVIEKFNLNLKECPTCELAEYACTCDHGSHEGHDHD